MEKEELLKKGNKNDVIFESYKNIGKFSFNASSRKEIIDIFTEFINGLEYDHYINIYGSYLCSSAPTRVIRPAHSSTDPHGDVSNPPARDENNTILPNG